MHAPIAKFSPCGKIQALAMMVIVHFIWHLCSCKPGSVSRGQRLHGHRCTPLLYFPHTHIPIAKQHLDCTINVPYTISGFIIFRFLWRERRNIFWKPCLGLSCRVRIVIAWQQENDKGTRSRLFVVVLFLCYNYRHVIPISPNRHTSRARLYWPPLRWLVYGQRGFFRPDS